MLTDLTSKPFVFWPTSSQTPHDRTLAAIRFVLYATTIIFVGTRDVRILGLAVVAIVIIYLMRTSNLLVPEAMCTKPTKDNPMGNFLLSDYVDRPTRGPACAVEEDAQTKLLSSHWPRDSADFWGTRQSTRPWYTMPSTTAANDVAKFRKHAYPFRSPHCRDGSRFCSTDSSFSRMPELPATRSMHPASDILF